MTNPDLNLGVLSTLTADDMETLTPEQESVLKVLRQHIIDYNLDKAEKPIMTPEIRQLVGAYSEREIYRKVFEYSNSTQPKT